MASSFGDTKRNNRDTTPNVLQASQYLQVRLQERRAKNDRPKRSRQTDVGPRRADDDDIFLKEAETNKYANSRMFESSPIVGGSRRGSDVDGSARQRAPGARSMEEHMDRLTKQNFALKLELDHRRANVTKLQEKIDANRVLVERAEQLAEEHKELLLLNSQLVEELERRDKAVEEAIETICELEDRVSELEERHSNTRPSTAHADSGYAGTEIQEQVPPSQQLTSPAASAAANKLFDAVDAQKSLRSRREPKVLSQKKASTHALRSVYLESAQSLHPVKSFNSLLTRQESRAEDEDDLLSSPRLSVLSESSFPSLYSPKKHASPDKYVWENDEEESRASTPLPASHLRQDSIKRVSQWMDERDEVEGTHSQSSRAVSPLATQEDTATPSLPAVCHDEATQYGSRATALSPAPPSLQTSSVRTKADRKGTRPSPMTFGGPMFSDSGLPPTPESASTRMLRASRSSIAEETSLLDTTPIAVRGYSALEPGLRTAPKQMRSSIELKSAYESYIQLREADDEAVMAGANLDDSRSESARELGLDYDGFPDGASLLVGTPSRFSNYTKAPFAGSTTIGGEISTQQQPLKAASDLTARKPGLARAGTSPPDLLTLGTSHTSASSVMSPRSYQSGSSNRTVVQSTERSGTLSPKLSRPDSYFSHNPSFPTSTSRVRASASPPRTLGQRAHGLLRRLSNTQRETSNHEREKSPLPTLTSTPSSAYTDTVPKVLRRPGTAQSNNVGGQRPPSSRDSRRPHVQTRMNTAPSASPETTSSTPYLARSISSHEKINPFRRSNSSKTGFESPQVVNGRDYGYIVSIEGGPGKVVGGGDSTVSRSRRGSFREAVGHAARRPWR